MNVKNIFHFLQNLSENNHKEWFDQNRKWYDTVKTDYLSLAENLLFEMSKSDQSLKNVDVKKCIFRINKDVRFSKDKSPYKTALGIILTPFGKKMFLGGYYIHLENNQSFVGGGLYMPPNDIVKKVRNEIITYSDEFLRIVKHKDFVGSYGDIDQRPEIMLAKVPKDVDPSSGIADYSRLKSFTVGKHYTNEMIFSKDFIATCVKDLNHLHNFIHFINRGITSDENGGI